MHRPGQVVGALAAWVLWVSAALVAGCGGGGGGGGGGGNGANGGGGAGVQIANAPAPAAVPAGQALQWDIFQVTVPATMTPTDQGTTMALDKPGCRIWLLPHGTAQADLAGLAVNYLQDFFNVPGRWGGVVGEFGASPLDDTFNHSGVTADGWRFVDLRGELLDATGHRSGEHVRILLTDVGGQAAPMVGYQTATGCIDEVSDPFEFVMLSYSMKFPTSTGDAAALGRALVGGWFGASTGPVGGIGVAWSDVFAANGEHSDLYGVQTYRQISPTLIEDRFSTWQGNGLWATRGNLLTVWPDGGTPSTSYFRVYAENGGFTYLRRLEWCSDHFCERWSTKD